MIYPPDHPLLKLWLSGTTCEGYSPRLRKAVMFENETHIVLRHYSHATYLGRFYDQKTCESYAQLWLKSELDDEYTLLTGCGMFDAPCGGSHQPIKCWGPGRINVKKIKLDCADLGITFEER